MHRTELEIVAGSFISLFHPAGELCGKKGGECAAAGTLCVRVRRRVDTLKVAIASIPVLPTQSHQVPPLFSPTREVKCNFQYYSQVQALEYNY